MLKCNNLAEIFHQTDRKRPSKSSTAGRAASVFSGSLPSNPCGRQLTCGGAISVSPAPHFYPDPDLVQVTSQNLGSFMSAETGSGASLARQNMPSFSCSTQDQFKRLLQDAEPATGPQTLYLMCLE